MKDFRIVLCFYYSRFLTLDNCVVNMIAIRLYLYSGLLLHNSNGCYVEGPKKCNP